MTTWHAVIDTASGELLRHGYSEMAYNDSIETLLIGTTRPRGLRTRRQIRTDDVSVWDFVNETWSLQDKDITVVQDRIINRLRQQVKSEVESRYPPHNQATYALMYSHAHRAGLNVRADYLEAAIGWADAVFGFFYQERDAILALTTVAAVQTYSWQAGLDALLAADPQASIEAARAIVT